MSKRIHVVPHGDGWATRREGASRVGSMHPTQSGANDAARSTAIRERGEVIIHRPDGRIRDFELLRQRPLPAEGLINRRAAPAAARPTENRNERQC